MTSMPLDNGDAVAANPIRAAEPWHLRNPHPHAGPHRLHVDMNVAPLAGTVQGRECRVAVVEPLQPTTRIHAHMVSSMVDGRRRPDVPGGVGVAPAARPRIYDLNTILEDTDLSAYTAVNMSYASTRPYSSDTRTIRMVHGLMKNGRNGLGSLLFSAAGNDRRGYYEPDKIQPQVTVMGSIDRNGFVAPSSARAPYVFAVAPGEAIPVHERGSFRGTSFASPLGTGVGCNMLEVNPYLGYRDAQDILALTARRAAMAKPDHFTANGAQTWNGGGYAFDRFGAAGFGLIDTYAAVRLAEVWDTHTPATAHNLQERRFLGVGPALSGTTTSSSIHFRPDENITIEHVMIHFHALEYNVKDGKTEPEDMVVILTSPAGTQVEIFRPAYADHPNARFRHSLSSATHAFRGEDLNGLWGVRVITDSGRDVTLAGWWIKAVGRTPEPRQRYVYTADFGFGFGKDTLTPTASAPTASARHELNAAAVATDNIIYLNGAGPSRIAGRALHIIHPERIDTVYSGDGHDTITAPSAGATIFAGRGNDRIQTTGGTNRIFYRPGIDGNDIIESACGADDTLVLRHNGPTPQIQARPGAGGILLHFRNVAGNLTGGIFLSGWKPGCGISTIIHEQQPNAAPIRIKDLIRATPLPGLQQAGI